MINPVLDLNRKCERCKENQATIIWHSEFICSKCLDIITHKVHKKKSKSSLSSLDRKEKVCQPSPPPSFQGKHICLNCISLKKKNRILESMLSRARKELRELKNPIQEVSDDG
jgi:hypothetical protein